MCIVLSRLSNGIFSFHTASSVVLIEYTVVLIEYNVGVSMIFPFKGLASALVWNKPVLIEGNGALVSISISRRMDEARRGARPNDENVQAGGARALEIQAWNDCNYNVD